MLVQTTPVPVLYRGDARPFSVGDEIIPCEGETVYRDKGAFVFASHKYEHALAYGLKAACQTADIGRGTCFVGMHSLGGHRFPVVLLGHSHPFAADRILEGTTCLQTVSGRDALGVFHNPPPFAALPGEWVFTNPVCVREVRMFSNLDVLRYGVQFMTGPLPVVRSIKGGREELLEIFSLVRRGILRWENGARAECANSPLARPTALAACMGATLG